MTWALGPAIGIGLTAHELEHHGHELDLPGVALAAAAVLHGHFHEEDEGEHGHDVTPPMSPPLRLAGESQIAVVAAAPAGGRSQPTDFLEPPGPLPELAALSPPAPVGLCVLRL